MQSRFPSDLCLILVGPTASGKTELIRSLAQWVPLEVVNCDSMQVYRGMPILTQPPKDQDLKAIPYHLQQVMSPTREFSAAAFQKKATKLIGQIQKRGCLPVVAGGTGLYVSVLLDGIFKGPEASPQLRKRLYAQAEKSSSLALYRKLEMVDPEAALKIHPHDTRRIVRALEVITLTGKRFSELKTQRKGLAHEMKIKMWGILWPREKLYERIDQRTRKMFREGVIKEASRVLKRKLSKTAGSCLGLKEIQAYLKDESSLKETKDLLAQNTRRYAKRQMTWFRKDQRIQWISMTQGVTLRKVARRIFKDLQV